MNEHLVPVQVLLVEDESLIALNLEQLVLDLGHRVTGPFATAYQARTAADIHPPDLAVIDLNLVDGRTGLALAHYLVEKFRTAVVIATANPEDARATSFIVLRKPYTDKAMQLALQEALLARQNDSAVNMDIAVRVDSGA